MRQIDREREREEYHPSRMLKGCVPSEVPVSQVSKGDNLFLLDSLGLREGTNNSGRRMKVGSLQVLNISFIIHVPLHPLVCMCPKTMYVSLKSFI